MIGASNKWVPEMWLLNYYIPIVVGELYPTSYHVISLMTHLQHSPRSSHKIMHSDILYYIKLWYPRKANNPIPIVHSPDFPNNSNKEPMASGSWATSVPQVRPGEPWLPETYHWGMAKISPIEMIKHGNDLGMVDCIKFATCVFFQLIIFR